MLKFPKLIVHAHCAFSLFLTEKFGETTFFPTKEEEDKKKVFWIDVTMKQSFPSFLFYRKFQSLFPPSPFFPFYYPQPTIQRPSSNRPKREGKEEKPDQPTLPFPPRKIKKTPVRHFHSYSRKLEHFPSFLLLFPFPLCVAVAWLPASLSHNLGRKN